MQLTKEEKELLTIIFQIAYSQLEVLKNHKCDVTSWGNSNYDSNEIYYLAEKLEIEI